MDLIIDAYNLIFQCGLEGPKRNPASIANSRGRLIQLLANLLPAEQLRCTTVVFDAKRLPRDEAQLESRKRGIRVLFAVGYESADEMIEELVAAHSHPKDLLIVSSDHRIQNAATRRKAKAIDSDLWLDRIEKWHDSNKDRGNQTQEGKPRQRSTSSKQVDSHVNSMDWSAEFGVDNQQASDKLVQEIEDELGLGTSKADGDPQEITDIEHELKGIDWMEEFGFDTD